jgi:zinc/manganese transport system substrate-binding protein
MRKLLSCACSALLLGVACASGADKVKVVAATLDMADFVREVGGERVDVYPVTEGQYDLHFYQPRPSQVMRLRRADMVVVSGMELDAFMPALIDAARNPGIRYGRPGFVDPSIGISAMNVPTNRITGDMGDVHPYGNPHYWFTPDNVTTACHNICEGLIRVAPKHRDYFTKRKDAYAARVKATVEKLKAKLAPYKGTPVLQFHESWNYFCDCFGLRLVGSLEPKPGVSPSAAHLSRLVKTIRREQVKLVLAEVYYPDRPLRFLRRNTDIKTLKLPLALGGSEKHRTYLVNLEYMVDRIVETLKE